MVVAIVKVVLVVSNSNTEAETTSIRCTIEVVVVLVVLAVLVVEAVNVFPYVSGWVYGYSSKEKIMVVVL